MGALTEPDINEADRPLIVVAVEEDHVAARMVAAVRKGDVRVLSAASVHEVVPADVLILYCEDVTAERLALWREVRRGHDQLHVVVVCGSADGKSARRAVSGGVEGLVFADRIETALLPTVRAVLAGQAVVPATLKASVRHGSLSSRERQALGLVALGLTNGEIACRMFLSESTVKSHLSSGFTKLGVRSRSEAAAMILDPDDALGAGILKIADQLQEAYVASIGGPDQARVDSYRFSRSRLAYAG